MVTREVRDVILDDIEPCEKCGDLHTEEGPFIVLKLAREDLHHHTYYARHDWLFKDSNFIREQARSAVVGWAQSHCPNFVDMAFVRQNTGNETMSEFEFIRYLDSVWEQLKEKRNGGS